MDECRRALLENMLVGKDNSISIKVKVHPNSRKQLLTIQDGEIHLYLESQPVRGEANKELIRFFKKKYRLKASIASGVKSREKILEIIGIRPDELVNAICKYGGE